MGPVIFGYSLLVTIAALFVIVRGVCVLRSAKEIGHMVGIFYIADVAGAAATIGISIADLRPPSLGEALFVIGVAVALIFDRRRQKDGPTWAELRSRIS